MKEGKRAQKCFRLGLICRINCCFDPWLCCLMNVSFYCIVFIMYWREFIWYVNWYNWMFLHLHDYHLKHASRIPIILWKNIKHRKCWSNLWFCKKEIFCKRHWSLYTLQLPLFVSIFEWTTWATLTGHYSQPWVNLRLAVQTLTSSSSSSRSSSKEPKTLFNSSLTVCLILTGDL